MTKLRNTKYMDENIQLCNIINVSFPFWWKAIEINRRIVQKFILIYYHKSDLFFMFL